MPVDPRTESGFGVVDVQHREAADPDDRIEFREGFLGALG